jgi:hypothetical protein
VQQASELFEETIEWLRSNYGQFTFFLERDVVWTLQSHINAVIRERKFPFHVFSDYPMFPGKRRRLCTDLAIVDPDGSVGVAAEFKYEPSHKRSDILQNKLPVVFWGKEGVGKDIERIRQYVEKGKARVAYAVFIDEGGFFHHRTPHPGSKWLDWGPSDTPPGRLSVLWSRADIQP